jgi:hypothetical protein
MDDNNSEEARTELQRAVQLLRTTPVDQQIASLLQDVLTVKKPSYISEIEWSKIVSKQSSFLSNIVEHALADLLNRTCSDVAKEKFSWTRATENTFPDIKLLDKLTQTDTGLGIEVKVVSRNADEASSRYLHASQTLVEGNVFVAILAWKWDDQKPVIFDSFIEDAKALAKERDHHHHCPPKNLVLQPNTCAKGTNLKQSIVKYQVWDSSQPGSDLVKAEEMVARWKEECGSQQVCPSEQMELVCQLQSMFKYRNDNNIGKLQRIPHSPLKKWWKWRKKQ